MKGSVETPAIEREVEVEVEVEAIEREVEGLMVSGLKA